MNSNTLAPPPVRVRTKPLRFRMWDHENNTASDDAVALFNTHHAGEGFSKSILQEGVKAGTGFFVSYLGSVPVGYIWINYTPRSRGRQGLSTLEYFVLPEHRRLGISKRMKLALAVFARNKGITTVELLHHSPLMVRQAISILRSRKRLQKKLPSLKSAVSFRIGKRTGIYRSFMVRIKPKRSKSV